MLLAIDVGNTRIKAAVFEDNTLLDLIIFDKNEMVEKIEQLLQNQNLANSLSVNGRVLAESFGWGNVKHLWQKLLL